MQKNLKSNINPYQPGFSQNWAFFSYLGNFFAPGIRKQALILFYAVLAMTFWVYLPAAPRLLTFDESGTSILLTSLAPEGSQTCWSRLQHLIQNSQQIWGAFLFFGFIPALIVKFIFREKLSDYGLTPGILNHTCRLTCLMVPLSVFAMFFAGKSSSYLMAYPYDPWLLGDFSGMKEGWPFLVLYFFLYFFVYYLSWEFFFRGFIQIGTESAVGCFNAILIGTIASTAVHFGVHPFTETVGAIGGGLLWGFFVYRTRSIFAGWFMHAALGIGLDFFLLYHFLP